jgi:hypothetical protein
MKIALCAEIRTGCDELHHLDFAFRFGALTSASWRTHYMRSGRKRKEGRKRRDFLYGALLPLVG